MWETLKTSFNVWKINTNSKTTRIHEQKSLAAPYHQLFLNSSVVQLTSTGSTTRLVQGILRGTTSSLVDSGLRFWNVHSSHIIIPELHSQCRQHNKPVHYVDNPMTVGYYRIRTDVGYYRIRTSSVMEQPPATEDEPFPVGSLVKVCTAARFKLVPGTWTTL